jgi:hypothetical protein
MVNVILHISLLSLYERHEHEQTEKSVGRLDDWRAQLNVVAGTFLRAFESTETDILYVLQLIYEFRSPDRKVKDLCALVAGLE